MLPGPWAFHGAFPRWHANQRVLYWADTLAPAIHCWDGHSSRLLTRLDLPIRGMELHPDGLLVAQAGGWSLIDWDGKEHPRQDLLGSRLLALAMHPSGNLWACAKSGNGCLIGELSAEGELRHGWSLPEPVSAFRWDAKGKAVYALAPEAGDILLMQPGSSSVRRWPRCRVAVAAWAGWRWMVREVSGPRSWTAGAWRASMPRAIWTR